MLSRVFYMVATLSLLASCAIAPKVELVTGQTALERQLLGKAAELDEKALLITPFRGKEGAESDSNISYRHAVTRRAFRQDEISQWVMKKWLIEGEDGLLHRTDTRPSTTIQKRFNHLTSEENSDRQQIIQWIILNNPNYHNSDAKKLGHIFYQLQKKTMKDR